MRKVVFVKEHLGSEADTVGLAYCADRSPGALKKLFNISIRRG